METEKEQIQNKHKEHIDVVVANNFPDAFLRTVLLLATRKKAVLGATEKNLRKVLQIIGTLNKLGCKIKEKDRFEYNVGEFKAIATTLENESN